MGSDSSSSSINDVKCFSLKEFQEKETPRKMTIHVLSNMKDNCISFVESLTGEKLTKFSDELLEKNIKKKIKLYSFMNYKLYDSAHSIMEKIKEKSKYIDDKPKSGIIFSEIIVVLDNKEITQQIEIIKQEIFNDTILSMQSFFNPFIIFLSPSELDLKGFIPSKTFQYRCCLKDIIDLKENYANTLEVMEFFRRINVLFSYYNELGDIFSFKNSNNIEVPIKIEDDTKNAVFINILLLGRSGAGKSTLTNLLLDEKKSIEGGTGFSMTSKNILVYQKKDAPIRLYDVKGIENEETIKNYAKILKKFNGKDSASKDCINGIFYCMQYKTGTIIEEMENKIFEHLIEFEIPILFIITKCPYDPNKNLKILGQKKLKK